jgi:TRAP-type C4-dicarboxylate transport system substrate-binding protein
MSLGVVALTASRACYWSRVQTVVPTASIHNDPMKRFGDRVNRMYAGRIKMEILPNGAVVGAFEILVAVDKGVVDGGFA